MSTRDPNTRMSTRLRVLPRAAPRRRSASATARDERGATLVLMALLMVVLISLVALAVDIGMMVTARTESQRVADASALAGAGWLRTDPDDAAGARQEAIKFADMHDVRKLPPSVLPEDVEVFLAEQRVRVTVRNTADRGNPIPTLFARVFGVDAVDVVTVAMAEVAEAGNPYCDLPLAIIDKCETEDGRCEEEPYIYDPENAPHYHLGEKVELKLSQNPDETPPACQSGEDLFDPCDVFNDASWHCWFLPYPEPEDVERNDDLRRRILGECPDGELISAGDTAYSTPGQAQALLEELAEFIDLHPDEFWDETQNCVVDGLGNCLANPKRVRSVPVVRPDQITGTGNEKQGPIIAWAGVFMEKVACGSNLSHRGGPPGHWNLYTRFVPTQGQNPAGPTTGEPTLKVLRLIE